MKSQLPRLLLRLKKPHQPRKLRALQVRTAVMMKMRNQKPMVLPPKQLQLRKPLRLKKLKAHQAMTVAVTKMRNPQPRRPLLPKQHRPRKQRVHQVMTAAVTRMRNQLPMASLQLMAESENCPILLLVPRKRK